MLLLIVGSASFSLEPPLEKLNGLSSVFGEYRAGHFHAGIDYRPQEGIGMKVYSPYSGYIQRIRVRTRGYGKALYLKTEKGYVAVFAHLDKFPLRIRKLLRERQEEKEKYPMQLWFHASDFPIDKGDLVGYLGRTGTSLAHLHFEVRKQATKRINPFRLGFETEDKKDPLLKSLVLLPLSDGCLIDGKPTYKEIDLMNGYDNDTVRLKDTIKVTGKFGVALSCSDRETESNLNRTGIYKLQGWLKDKEFVSIKYDSFSYSNNRKVGVLYDLLLEKREELRYQRLYNPLGSKIDFLPIRRMKRGLKLSSYETAEVKIEVEDFWGHSRWIIFGVEKVSDGDQKGLYEVSNFDENTFRKIEYSSFFLEDVLYLKIDKEVVSDTFGENLGKIEILKYNQDSKVRDTSFLEHTGDSILIRINPSPKFETIVIPITEDSAVDLKYYHVAKDFGGSLELADNELILDIPRAAFYEDCYIMPEFKQDKENKKFIVKATEGLFRKNIELLIPMNENRSKRGIYRTWRGEKLFLGDSVIAGSLSSEITAPGEFVICRDTVAPVITTTLEEGKVYDVPLVEIPFTVKDNLSGFGRKNLPQLFIDGSWVSADYHPQTGSFDFTPLYNLKPGNYKVECKATDRSGNKTVKIINFSIKEE